MSDQILFELDTSGQSSSRRSSRMFYNTIGDLEITEDAQSSKPSQERPAILKSKSKRYHQQELQKKFTPGVLSKSLRRALGLRSVDIPEHIYRMRHLGYPPGWLRKAEVTHDGITIFGANNESVKPSQKNVKYDWDQLHEYPGFNTLNGYNERYDFSSERGFMSMQSDCLLENFKSFLHSTQLLGKEATDIEQIRSANSTRNSGTDFNLPPSSSTPKRPRCHDDAASPREKRARLEVSDDTEEVISLSDGELVDDDDVDNGDDCHGDGGGGENGEPSPIAVSASSTPVKSRVAMDTGTEEGTLLLESSSSGALKPSLDRFSEGINEHRLFENLPGVATGASGTYQRVKDVLRRSRP